MTLETICDKKWRIIDTHFVTDCFLSALFLYLYSEQAGAYFYLCRLKGEWAV